MKTFLSDFQTLWCCLCTTHLSARFDTFHETKENHDPWQKKGKRNGIIESSQISRLSNVFGDVQNEPFPILLGRCFLRSAIFAIVNSGNPFRLTTFQAQKLIGFVGGDGTVIVWPSTCNISKELGKYLSNSVKSINSFYPSWSDVDIFIIVQRVQLLLSA